MNMITCRKAQKSLSFLRENEREIVKEKEERERERERVLNSEDTQFVHKVTQNFASRIDKIKEAIG